MRFEVINLATPVDGWRQVMRESWNLCVVVYDRRMIRDLRPHDK